MSNMLQFDNDVGCKIEGSRALRGEWGMRSANTYFEG